MMLTAIALAMAMSLQSGLGYIEPESGSDAAAVGERQIEAALSEVDLSGGFGALSLRRPRGNERLLVYPEGFAGEVKIGDWLQFRVFLDGEEIPYADYTCALESGADCAAAYYTGEILALGEGDVSLRVWLDEDESVYGLSGAVRVVQPDAPNDYTSCTGCPAAAEASDEAFESAIAEFPESYRASLRVWHQFYPSWEFDAIDTGLDFWSAVDIQSSGARNVTLLANNADLLKSRDAGDYADGSYIMKDTGWVETSELAVAYYLDAGNSLADYGLFQHESLAYDESFHTLGGVESIIGGTFMAAADTDYLDADGALVKTGVSYARAIMNAAAETGVNPYYLAAKIRGEIGSTKSRSVSGDVEGYEGYYNYYNIGATDGEGNVERALEYAMGSGSYGRPWDSPEKAITGGARFLAGDYISSGQDTGYLQKWNVAPYTATTKHLHQYMTNVSGALAQSFSSYNGYAGLGMLDTPIRFAIPVYDDMPADTATSLARADGGASFGITTAAVRLRGGARSSAGSVAELRAGTVVEILSCERGDTASCRARLIAPYWYLVSAETADGVVTGYAREDDVNAAATAVLRAGESADLSVAVLPADCGDDVRYISRDRDVASVDGDGVVTALGAGRAEIVAYTANGCFCALAVDVL